ncbi:MAG: hypothetical protein ACRC3G_00265 [Bacteroidales bacterium]
MNNELPLLTTATTTALLPPLHSVHSHHFYTTPLPPPYYHVIAGLTRNLLFIRNTFSLTGIIHTVLLPPALNSLPPSDMGKGTKKCSEGGIKILTE